MKIIKLLLLFFIFSLSIFANDNEIKEETIKVLLKNIGSEVTITASNQFLIIHSEESKIIEEACADKVYTFFSQPEGIQMDNIGVFKGTIEIKTEQDGKIKVNDKPYYGEITIINAEAEGKLLLINKVCMKQYLAGVMSKEISSSWPMEALKAQAVAARTFALRKKEKNKGKLYDVDDTFICQVYGGALSNNERIKKAIELTEDEVLMYQHKLAATYYHSACGGHTEKYSHVWQGSKEAFPYLRVVPCNYCQQSPYSSWKCNIKKKDLLKKLQDNGYLIEKIQKIKFLRVKNTQRIISVNISHPFGYFTIAADTFRKILGFFNLKSAFFDLKQESQGNLLFYGKGFGHGVGMCQWGTKGMADAGYDYKEILNYYYPNTILEKL